jgi:predicted nucleic acid-binding Zn ribbon protein
MGRQNAVMSVRDWSNHDEFPERREPGSEDAQSAAGGADRATVPHEVDLTPCPFCKRAVRHDADVCHHCRNFILHDAPARVRPNRWVVVALLGLLTILLLCEFYWLRR